MRTRSVRVGEAVLVACLALFAAHAAQGGATVTTRRSGSTSAS
jgi:hypothetical protein